MARYLLVSPRIAVQKSDFLGSGVPYWPMELSVFAAFLRARGDEVAVFDLFGSSPGTLEDRGDHYLQGRALRDRLGESAFTQADAIVLYALSYMSHRELLDMCREVRERRPAVPIAILENSQAVTAYGLNSVSTDFFAAGADLLVCGEAYWNWAEIGESLVRRGASPAPENVLTPSSVGPVKRWIEKEPTYPVPAWDLFPVENYWRLPYSHGPKTATFLPVLTSRGCPYPCDFCVVPETNSQRWRPRPPAEVVDEMITLRDRFGVHDFQIEDLNPTVRGSRWREVCEGLIARKAGIRFYFVSGTKAETVKVDDVPLLARAGCRYISISPESGSPRLMKVIGKRFDHAHGLLLRRASSWATRRRPRRTSRPREPTCATSSAPAPTKSPSSSWRLLPEARSSIARQSPLSKQARSSASARRVAWTGRRCPSGERRSFASSSWRNSSVAGHYGCRACARSSERPGQRWRTCRNA
jgi:anaerobic magnesium-protoporphyrin IX monomethyl ester cyclase